MRWAGAGADPADPALPDGAEPLAATCAGARRNSRAGSRRSAWSTRGDGAAARRDCSSPASGWFRAKATCGAGTALRSPRMRRPARRAGSPSAAACTTIETELRAARAEVEAQPHAPSRRREADARRRRGRQRSRRAQRWREAQRAADAAREAPRRGRARDRPQRGAHLRADRGARAGSSPAATKPTRRATKRERALAALAAADRDRAAARRRCATRSTRRGAQRSPRCAPRRRRSRARPSWPSGGSQPSPASAQAWSERRERRRGADRHARARAPTKPRAERARLADAPQGFAAQRQRADRRDRDGRRPRAAPPPTGWPRPRPRLPKPTRRRAPRSKPMGAARAEAARAEERYEGAKRRLADVAHEIREMLRGRARRRSAALAEHRAGRGAAVDCRGRGRARAHPPRARAARRRQSARRGGIARGRGPARHADQPSATIWSRRSSGCARASTASTSEARERLLASFDDRQRAISSSCSPSCSAAAPPSCS